MSAVSVFGRTGHHSAPRKSGASARVGLATTNSTPAALAARSHFSIECSPAPPAVTCPFLSASPPKATTSFVFATTLAQSVTRPATGSWVPMTCGSRNCAAPQL